MVRQGTFTIPTSQLTGVVADGHTIERHQPMTMANGYRYTYIQTYMIDHILHDGTVTTFEGKVQTESYNSY